MFIPWFWILVESRHQSLKSMIAEMWLLLWKWNANQGRVLLKATLGWRKAFFAFTPVTCGHSYCSFCWNSSINVIDGLPFLWFSLVLLTQNDTLNKNFSKNLWEYRDIKQENIKPYKMISFIKLLCLYLCK